MRRLASIMAALIAGLACSSSSTGTDRQSCHVDCALKHFGDADGCGGICTVNCGGRFCPPPLGCTARCLSMCIGDYDGCGSVCTLQSGADSCTCVPECQEKCIGDSDGCGFVCMGAGDGARSCCVPDCAGKCVNADDGCGAPCTASEGATCTCSPSCSGKCPGADDGCGLACRTGSAPLCCLPVCQPGSPRGAPDGCGGVCLATNVVFVTSTTFQPGALGGLAGADAACQNLAAAAGLPGTFKAWLSTSGAGGVNAIARLAGARGWVRRDGKSFVDTTANLAAGKIMYPPRLDEAGNDLGMVRVLTGTSSDGTYDSSGGTCGNYTDTADAGQVAGGSASAGSSMFTNYFSFGCSSPGLHLYCFETDWTAPVLEPPATGRVAFVTRGVLTPGRGLAAADGLCQTEANLAGLIGTFRAALATTGSSIQSRFTTNGASWVRPDGLPLAPSAAALFASAYTDVALDVSADGALLFVNDSVWNGSASWSAAGTAASSCSDYTATSGGGAISGITGDTYAGWLVGQNQVDTCSDAANRLLCLQE